MRTNTFGAVFRVRHHIAYAIHKFFHEEGYYYLHTPIITGSDAEGAGEMFRVTTLDLKNPPLTEEGAINFKEDFFGKETNLTVSGQLEAEVGAMSLGKVYTFGPTFRAENSNTTRHLAEFWMIEPEIAFAAIEEDMDLAEDMLKYVIRYVVEHCPEELKFLEQRIVQEDKNKPQQDRQPMDLLEKLQFILEHDFERITYTEAIRILKNSKPNKKKKFNFVIEDWGADLQSEHERYLVEKHFKKPVIIYNYPKDIKAFYMRMNDDNQTVAAMDILFPGIGEIVGGSQREERLDVLQSRMADMNVPEEELSWYLDLRKFGTAPHAGFGLGFERLVQFITGMTNIRDVIAFPRYPGHAEF
jgi:asparaginyl-tRNA synthetase